MQKRLFNRRWVGDREELYEPDPDCGANWDYLAAICWALAIAGLLILFALTGLVIG